MIRIEFNTTNAAFEESPTGEIGRILRDLATRIEDGQFEGPIRDSNGNKVGSYFISEPDESEDLAE